MTFPSPVFVRIESVTRDYTHRAPISLVAYRLAMHVLLQLCAEVRIKHQFHADLQGQIVSFDWGSVLGACVKFKVLITFNHKIRESQREEGGTEGHRNKIKSPI